jgi:putative photosynthetic complex assembly protein 2
VSASLASFGLPLAYAVFVWWFTTGLILWLDGLPQRTHSRSLMVASLVLVLALGALAHGRRDTSVAGAYCAFSCAIVVWGWVEMTFLMGYVTGSRTEPCPAGARGWRRFVCATQAIMHHEMLIAACALAVALATLDGDNQTGLRTFLLLWVMRLSAKLNLFLGVRNLSEEFLPVRLRYLATYFARRPMNLLFPFSVTMATLVTAGIGSLALSADVPPGAAAGHALVAVLLGLAVLEHWLMVLPVSATALWKWCLGARGASGEKPGAILTGPVKRTALAPGEAA